MRTLANYLASLSTKTNTNGTEKLTALDGSALVGVPNQSYQVVDGIADLPASIPVGVQILTRDSGTMWRGLVAGESSLPAGTPWPVKGYKEVRFALVNDPAGNWGITPGYTDFDIDPIIKEILSNPTRIDINFKTTNQPVAFRDGTGPTTSGWVINTNSIMSDRTVSRPTGIESTFFRVTNPPASVPGQESYYIELKFYPPAPTP
jgi:hypothetical protein